MKATLFSIIVLGLALVAMPAHAALTRSDRLGASCIGGCVDTWQVDCSSGKTGRIEARVRDLIDGDANRFAVTTMGFAGTKLFGKSDREVVVAPESGSFSIPAFLSLPVATDQSMKGLVMITVIASASGSSTKSYVVEFVCRDAFGVSETGDPKAKLLGDQ